MPDSFLSNNVNGFEGHLLICDSYVSRLYPSIVSELSTGKQVFEYSPESNHIDQLGFKLCTALRLHRIDSMTTLTKDGSPHSLQIPLVAQEAAQNVDFPLSSVYHFVVEQNRLVAISKDAVRTARHLSEITTLLDKSQEDHPVGGLEVSNEVTRRNEVAILVGGRSDLDVLNRSKLLPMLRQMDVPFIVTVISSEQNPRELRDYCLNVLSARISVCICVAGLVPGLPAAVKSHIPTLPVIAVPISGPGFDARDIMLASFSLPSRRPVMLSGLDEAGLNKAAHLVCELIGIGEPAFRRGYSRYLDESTPKPDYEIDANRTDEAPQSTDSVRVISKNR